MPRLNSRLRQARREYGRAASRYAEFAFQMRIELVGIEPAIWRRCVVSGALEARYLHRVLERVMGWQGGHMSGVHFPRPAGATARRLLLGDRLEVGERFGFYYDFGDSWRHEVVVEKRVFPVPERPVVVAGERACPPEDCGGVSGYERVLAMLANPGRRSDQELRSWLNEVEPGWTPEAFDLARTNVRLSRMRLGA